jgi:hypothetical protein
MKELLEKIRTFAPRPAAQRTATIAWLASGCRPMLADEYALLVVDALATGYEVGELRELVASFSTQFDWRAVEKELFALGAKSSISASAIEEVFGLRASVRGRPVKRKRARGNQTTTG